MSPLSPCCSSSLTSLFPHLPFAHCIRGIPHNAGLCATQGVHTQNPALSCVVGLHSFSCQRDLLRHKAEDLFCPIAQDKLCQKGTDVAYSPSKWRPGISVRMFAFGWEYKLLYIHHHLYILCSLWIQTMRKHFPETARYTQKIVANHLPDILLSQSQKKAQVF